MDISSNSSDLLHKKLISIGTAEQLPSVPMSQVLLAVMPAKDLAECNLQKLSCNRTGAGAGMECSDVQASRIIPGYSCIGLYYHKASLGNVLRTVWMHLSKLLLHVRESQGRHAQQKGGCRLGLGDCYLSLMHGGM